MCGHVDNAGKCNVQAHADAVDKRCSNMDSTVSHQLGECQCTSLQSFVLVPTQTALPGVVHLGPTLLDSISCPFAWQQLHHLCNNEPLLLLEASDRVTQSCRAPLQLVAPFVDAALHSCRPLAMRHPYGCRFKGKQYASGRL